MQASRTGLGVVPYDPESLKMIDEQVRLENRGYYTTIVNVNVLWVKSVKLEQGMSKRRWGLLVEFISRLTGIHSTILTPIAVRTSERKKGPVGVGLPRN